MKIAVAFPGVHRKGGVERVAFECARYLSDRNHDVTVLADEWERDETRPIRYRHVSAAAWPHFRRPTAFFRNATKTLLELSGSFDALATYGCVCPTGGVYWVQSVHAAWMEHSRRLRPSLSMIRWKQRLNPIHACLLRLEQKHLGERRYKKLIALTDDVRDDLTRYYGVPAEDVIVLPNGFAASEFNLEQRGQLRAEMRRRLGYGPTDHIVIFVANELERKGFGPLLRAIERTGDARLKLLAVGRLNANAYSAEIGKLGLADRVQFSGPTAGVMSYYAAADAFALPTQYEAWGMVIVEAMACGLPVIASRLAGAAVAVKEPANGYLLNDPGDVEEITGKLRKLLAGEFDGAERISQSVQAYSWANVLAKYEEVLLGTGNFACT
ncbi:MAG TPA: glycosyltransferase family 4 protein [Humisphaera sp.]|nr:glycosyltransferase family 4 protein [Humisphaera sp.]